jgi:two-component system phosphate regulon response regulator PhoB
VELTARIRAVLRRTAPAGIPQTLEIGGLQLDQNTHRVTVGNLELSFTPTEYRLLHFLMTHPERVYSRSQLLDNAWPNDSFVEERTVDVHIRRLRKLLEPSGHDRLVQTVRGAGYRLSTRTR